MVNLKKQSQFAEGENEHKFSHDKGLRRNSMFWQPMKTNPIQSQSQTKSGLFSYGARDCHGPSGLAMTSGSLCLSGFVAMRNLKKQSQFAVGRNWRKVLFERCL